MAKSSAVLSRDDTHAPSGGEAPEAARPASQRSLLTDVTGSLPTLTCTDSYAPSLRRTRSHLQHRLVSTNTSRPQLRRRWRWCSRHPPPNSRRPTSGRSWCRTATTSAAPSTSPPGSRGRPAPGGCWPPNRWWRPGPTGSASSPLGRCSSGIHPSGPAPPGPADLTPRPAPRAVGGPRVPSCRRRGGGALAPSPVTFPLGTARSGSPRMARPARRTPHAG
jgi:hypothetical protein